jgi:protein-disulfide isomerase
MPKSSAPRSDRSTLWFAIGVILGAAIGHFFGARANRIREAAEQAGITLPTTVVDVSVEGRPFKGPADAPVTILEFTDYECSFCARF